MGRLGWIIEYSRSHVVNQEPSVNVSEFDWLLFDYSCKKKVGDFRPNGMTRYAHFSFLPQRSAMWE